MNKAQKQQYIENLDQMSKDYSAIFIASFSNMSVKEMVQFRTEIRNNEGVTKISKNNIVKIFIDKTEDKKSLNEFLSVKLLIFLNNPVDTAKVCKNLKNLKTPQGQLSITHYIQKTI